MPAEQQGLDVLDAVAQLHADEGAEAGGIEDAGLADHAVSHVDHRVERV